MCDLVTVVGLSLLEELCTRLTIFLHNYTKHIYYTNSQFVGEVIYMQDTESVVFTAERRKKTFACDVPFYEVLLGPAETESQMTCL